MKRSNRRQEPSAPAPLAGAAHSLYTDAGVDTSGAANALAELLTSVKQTFALRSGTGRPLLDIGFYANVLDLGFGLGLAISTDGVGSKLLVAEMMDKYDTVGIDCIAMNVNDVICVGAEPIAMTDYIGVQVPDAAVFKQLGLGLLKGAELSGITIPGGEVAQIAEMIRGVREGRGFDLVGTCVGLVPADKVLTGAGLEEGDAIVGLASSGIHSNGLTLARRVLLDSGRYAVDSYVADLGRTLGEELLEPTAIYVRFAVEALRAGLPVKAFAHITSEGFLNLARVSAPAGFEIETLPEPPPIFRLIQQAGNVPDDEMYSVFNMGTGFCAVVPEAAVAELRVLAGKHGHESVVLGHVRHDPTKQVRVLPLGLQGTRGSFSRA
jgi:phosphoribosylformylglycinamidine cyclo-ligase